MKLDYNTDIDMAELDVEIHCPECGTGMKADEHSNAFVESEDTAGVPIKCPICGFSSTLMLEF